MAGVDYNTGNTGYPGTDGLQGPYGPTGPTGLRGLTGWGDYIFCTGPGGPANFSPSLVSSGTSVTVSTTSLGTSYYITTRNITGITLPASMTGITSGAFWTFQNNSDLALPITLTNGTAVYNGSSSATSILIPSGTGLTLVYTGSGQNYIVF